MKARHWILVTVGAALVGGLVGGYVGTREPTGWERADVAQAALLDGMDELGGWADSRQIAWGSGTVDSLGPGQCALVLVPRGGWIDDTTTEPPLPVHRRAQTEHFAVDEVCNQAVDPVYLDPPFGSLTLAGSAEAVARHRAYPSLEDRYARELRADNLPAAILAGLLVFVVVGGAGLGFVPRGSDAGSMTVTSLRRVVLAVDGELRPSLQAILGGEEARLADLRAARDLLAQRVDAVRQVAWQRWRGRPKEIDERWSEARPVPPPAGRTGSGYREGGDGLVVVELRLRHRCELLPMPREASRERLRDMLESMIPADDHEVVAVEARLWPSDPTARYDEDALREGWPALVAVGREGLRACDACEALHLAERCPACGTEA